MSRPAGVAYCQCGRDPKSATNYLAAGALKTFPVLASPRKLNLTLRPFNSSMIRTGLARGVPVLRSTGAITIDTGDPVRNGRGV